MRGGLLISMAISLPLTIVFEGLFFFIVGKRSKRDLQLLVLVNILTNPAVVFLLWLSVYYFLLNKVIITVLLESVAILTEAICYKRYGETFRRPFFFSVAANAVSYGTGLLLQTVLQ